MLEALGSRQATLLLDLNLPKVDGMQVLRTPAPAGPETCVLILSARSEIADKEWRAGCRGGRLSFQALPSLPELEAGAQPDPAQIYPAGCLPVLRTTELHTRSRVAVWTVRPLPWRGRRAAYWNPLLAASGPPSQQEELIEHVWDGSVDSFSPSGCISALRKNCRRRGLRPHPQPGIGRRLRDRRCEVQ